jgi:hypothetical protein
VSVEHLRPISSAEHSSSPVGSCRNVTNRKGQKGYISALQQNMSNQKPEPSTAHQDNSIAAGCGILPPDNQSINQSINLRGWRPWRPVRVEQPNPQLHQSE